MKPEVLLLESAIGDAARYFEKAIREETRIDVSVKADKSLVLNLDLESQEIIRGVLGTTLPVVAEEDPASHSLIDSEPDYFLVDPLDGTSSCKRFLGVRGGQVGFGPLGGYVKDGVLTAACYYNVTTQTFYTAVRGEGTWAVQDLKLRATLPPLRSRTRLVIKPPERLTECAALFYTGARGEIPCVEYLRREGFIENAYRFGGFANDCVRLAHDYEQVQVQFAVKPWDLSAALITAEAGYALWFEPLANPIPFSKWKIQMNNPLIAVPPSVEADLFRGIKGIAASLSSD